MSEKLASIINEGRESILAQIEVAYTEPSRLGREWALFPKLEIVEARSDGRITYAPFSFVRDGQTIHVNKLTLKWFPPEISQHVEGASLIVECRQIPPRIIEYELA